MPGIDLYDRFSVANLRPARRIGPDGESRTEIVFEVVQPAGDKSATTWTAVAPLRGGVTVIVGLDDWKVRYSIYKPSVTHEGWKNTDRLSRQRNFEGRLAATFGMNVFGAAEYLCSDADAMDGDQDAQPRGDARLVVPVS